MPGSWETFLRSYGPRIRVIALRQGADAGQAEAVAEEMGGALLLPPARGGARTRMGTYDGTAPLGAWLAGIVHHRLADLRRARRATSLDDLLRRAEEGAEAAAVPAADVGDPGQEAGDAESATAFGASIRRALDALTERERSALVARYGEGLSQEEIGRRLGVGAPRVSRLLDSAREKVRAAVLSMPGGTPLPDGDRAWSALRDVLGSRLATSPPKHVSREGDSDSGA